jgi:hypothetical protein
LWVGGILSVAERRDESRRGSHEWLRHVRQSSRAPSAQFVGFSDMYVVFRIIASNALISRQIMAIIYIEPLSIATWSPVIKNNTVLLA